MAEELKFNKQEIEDIGKKTIAISTLNTYEQRYGLQLTSNEKDSIINIALKSRSIENKVKNELFKILAERNPKKAIKIEIVALGKKYEISEETKNEAIQIAKKDGYRRASDYLSNSIIPRETPVEMQEITGIQEKMRKYINGMKITIDGKEMSVSEAINEAKKYNNINKKTEFVKKIINNVMERWRIKNSNKGENDLGFTAKNSTLFSDPNIAIEQKTINCFSGSIIAAAVASSIVRDAGVKADVKITEVAAIDISEEPHVIMEIRFPNKKESYLYDTTYTIAGGPLKRINPTQAKRKDAVYFLGQTMTIAEAFRAAQTQQNLSEGKISIEDFYNLPPVYQQYMLDIMYLSKNSNLEEIEKKIDYKRMHPSIRAKFASTFASYYFDKGNKTKAIDYAKILATSLVETYEKKESSSLKVMSSIEGYAKSFGVLFDSKDYAHAFIIYEHIRAGFTTRVLPKEDDSSFIKKISLIHKEVVNRINNANEEQINGMSEKMKNETPERIYARNTILAEVLQYDAHFRVNPSELKPEDPKVWNVENEIRKNVELGYSKIVGEEDAKRIMELRWKWRINFVKAISEALKKEVSIKDSLLNEIK